ncbi:alginate export family protein [Enterovirga sp. GCM10030262]|uniref:alginate export family protein n=1 Tax=Enterovirga sp. GCM10030262 TaxID=3273391 RepID=UPI003617B70D
MRCALLSAGLATALLPSPVAAEPRQPWTLHQALGSPENWTISGSLRARYEKVEGQFRPGLNARDDIVLIRASLFAEYDAGPVRIGGELIDSRAYDTDPGGPVGTGEVNTLEPVQAYIGFDLDDALGKDSRSSLTLGRLTMDLGSRRLIGRNNFRNTTNAFTGARFAYAGAGGDSLTLFYTLPHNRLPSDKESILDNEVQWDDESNALTFWGGFYTRPDLIGGVSGDFYLFALDEDDRHNFPTRDRKLFTPGLRLFKDPKASRLDLEFEAALQFGDIRSGIASDAAKQDVSAHFLHAEIGYTFPGAWRPRLAFEYDVASGDGAGGDFGRFDSLYGVRRPDYGPTSIYGPLGRSNISSPGVRLEVKPDERWDGFLFYRAAWLDERSDSFASTGVRDPQGASGGFGGHQIEARARYWVVPKLLKLDVGGAWLVKGGFLENAPNANPSGNTRYFYVDLTASF